MVYASLAHFLWPERFDEQPIPDFRTMRPGRVRPPSPHLLDTIDLGRHRQEWYREYALEEEHRVPAFVSSARLDENPVDVAAAIRAVLGFDLDARRDLPNWGAALRHLIQAAERAGSLVMVSSVVGNNTHRRLDPEEFGGFALSDDRAPLAFVNGAGAKAARMFTLVHELAHLWLGETALSDARLDETPTHDVEKWCARVAVEVLAPLSAVKHEVLMPNGAVPGNLASDLKRLAHRFKVSPLIVLRRIHDAGLLTDSEFREAYDRERTRPVGRDGRSGGNRDGVFLATQKARLGENFASAAASRAFSTKMLLEDARDLLELRRWSALKALHDEFWGSW